MTVTDLARIQDAVASYWPQVRYVETTGSTNADMVKEGEAGMVLIANEQTASKGRLNRTWVTPKGAQLAMSMVIDAGTDPNHYGLLSLSLIHI